MSTGSRKSDPRKGRRFPPEVKEEVLRRAEEVGAADACQQAGISTRTLARWRKRQQTARSETDPQGRGGLVDRSRRPERLARTVAPDVAQLVLATWLRDPQWGPSQVRMHLRRHHGLTLSVKLITAILTAHGYRPRRRREPPQVWRRFEAERPNQLWQMDLAECYIHRQKVYLAVLLDDFSRYVVGWGLALSADTDHVLGVVSAAIARHGKPEALLSDRGMQFYSWRGINRFQRYLEEMLIDQVLARPHHPQTCGKVEALIKTVQRELIRVHEFADVEAAAAGLAEWFEDYNHRRTHQGIGGLIPADRYFGRSQAVLAAMQNKAVAAGYDVEGRLPALQLLPQENGLELWVWGRRYWLREALDGGPEPSGRP